jgi:hypothetical protein
MKHFPAPEINEFGRPGKFAIRANVSEILDDLTSKISELKKVAMPSILATLIYEPLNKRGICESHTINACSYSRYNRMKHEAKV